MITADQIVAHLIGDYLLQSHWMATNKTRSSVAAAVHALCYTLPFLLLTGAFAAICVILVTHFVIDRFRVAAGVVTAKNILLAPPDPALWRSIDPATGYPKDTPPWLAVWLLIAADNTLHVLINGAAIRWLGP